MAARSLDQQVAAWAVSLMREGYPEFELCRAFRVNRATLRAWERRETEWSEMERTGVVF